MAQLSVLVCDLCTGKNKFAIVTREMVGVGELDLCKKHDKIITKPFIKLKQHGPKAKLGKRQKSKLVNYDELTAKIMKIAPKLQPFNAREVHRVLKLSSDSIAWKACKMLVKAGKLKSTGKGPGRKLVLANGHVKAAA